MRTATTMCLAIALIAAACAGSPAATPTTTPTVPPPILTTVPATPSEAAMASPTAVSARVTFDGSTCDYTGPTVIPFPADMTIEFAPDSSVKDAAIGIIAIKGGTTEAQLNDPANPDVGAGTPAFAYLDSHMFSQGVGTGEYRAVPSGSNPMADPAAADGKPYDTYLVMCLPTLPGRPAGGFTILHVVAARTSPIPSTAP